MCIAILNISLREVLCVVAKKRTPKFVCLSADGKILASSYLKKLNGPFDPGVQKLFLQPTIIYGALWSTH